MNPGPELNTTAAIAATGQTKAAATKAAAAPRIKLSSHGFCLDHPDPKRGEQLMADALGVTDRDAMHGILKQLVKAGVNGEKPDEVNLAFMISMVKSIKPQGFRRGHADGADGLRSCDGDALCLSAASPCWPRWPSSAVEWRFAPHHSATCVIRAGKPLWWKSSPNAASLVRRPTAQ